MFLCDLFAILLAGRRQQLKSCDAGKSLTSVTTPPEAAVLLKVFAIDSLDILALVQTCLAGQDVLGVRAHHVAHKRRQRIQVQTLCLVCLYCNTCLLVESQHYVHMRTRGSDLSGLSLSSL